MLQKPCPARVSGDAPVLSRNWWGLVVPTKVPTVFERYLGIVLEG
jgi:hypothetical protein